MWPPLRSVLFMTASRTAIRRSRGVVLDDHRHDVDLGVGLDEGLDHPLAERAVAQDRRRHDRPAAGLRDVPGGDLAAGQRPVGEVVERPLAEGRLVDRVEHEDRLGSGSGQVRVTRDEHRVVRRRRRSARRSRSRPRAARRASSRGRTRSRPARRRDERRAHRPRCGSSGAVYASVGSARVTSIGCGPPRSDGSGPRGCMVATGRRCEPA